MWAQVLFARPGVAEVEVEAGGVAPSGSSSQKLEVLRCSFGHPGELERESGTRIWSTTTNT